MKNKDLIEKIKQLKERALIAQKDWHFPNEIYIETNGAIMACDEILEYFESESKQKPTDDDIEGEAKSNALKLYGSVSSQTLYFTGYIHGATDMRDNNIKPKER